MAVLARAVREEYEPWAVEALVRGYDTPAEAIDEEKRALRRRALQGVSLSSCSFQEYTDGNATLISVWVCLEVDGKVKQLKKQLEGETEVLVFSLNTLYELLHNLGLLEKIPIDSKIVVKTNGEKAEDDPGVYIQCEGKWTFQEGSSSLKNVLTAGLNSARAL